MPSRPSTSTVLPGSYLLHPLIVCSLALWILNDHVLKAAWPGTVTGKLSDIVSLIVFPLLMATALEKAQKLWTRHVLTREHHNRLLLIAIFATGAMMVTINCFHSAAIGYEWGLGYVQWPAYCLQAILMGSPLPEVAPVQLWMDPSDCFTLPALVLPLWIAWRPVPSLHRLSFLQPMRS